MSAEGGVQLRNQLSFYYSSHLQATRQTTLKNVAGDQTRFRFLFSCRLSLLSGVSTKAKKDFPAICRFCSI